MGPLAACRQSEYMKVKEARWEILQGPANPPPHHLSPAMDYSLLYKYQAWIPSNNSHIN